MLSLDDALRTDATMMNTQNADELAPLLADDFHYSSKWAFAQITFKQEYFDFIAPKLASVRTRGAAVWAKIVRMEQGMPGPCVALDQGEKDALTALELGKAANGNLGRLGMCAAPSPRPDRRSGEYPRST